MSISSPCSGAWTYDGREEAKQAMESVLKWVDWLLNPLQWIVSFVASVVGKGADNLSADHRDDPAYKENLQRLIEQNRSFEEKRE